MGFLDKNQLLRILDSGYEQTRSFIDEFDMNAIKKFDFNEQFKRLNEVKEAFEKKSKELFGEFEKMMKETNDKFILQVPFDRSNGEKLFYKLKEEERLLKVKTTKESEDGKKSSMVDTTVPEEFDLDTINVKEDKQAKLVIFSFDKKKEEEPQDEEDEYGEEFMGAADEDEQEPTADNAEEGFERIER